MASKTNSESRKPMDHISSPDLPSPPPPETNQGKDKKSTVPDPDAGQSYSKRERVRSMLQKKKECEKEALEIVHKLIEPNVDKEYLLDKAGKIAPHHWEDIVEERKLTGICGWVFCDQKLGKLPKQKYLIRNNRLLDITERKNFCSPNCYGQSVHFKAQLLTSPLWLRDEEEEELPKFTLVQENEQCELHGLMIKLKTTGIGPDSGEIEGNKEDDEAYE